MSEHILWETIKERNEQIEELTKENRSLDERCNQLLKDKRDLTDKITDIKANCDLAIEGRDVKIKELEQKLEQTEKDLADYQFNYPTIKELEEEIRKKADTNHSLVEQMADLESENAELKAKEKQLEKVEYTLKKIIETVHNDRIDYYGERLVLIYDFANECLEEIEKCN